MRPKMGRALRAKQFMPFAALKGYEAALRQRERVVLPRTELGEDAQEALDRALRQIHPGDPVTAVYYDGGMYLERAGLVSKLDPAAGVLWVVKTPIPFAALRSLVVEG